MPPAPAIPPALVKAAALTAAIGPWWAIPVIGLLSAVLVVLITEWAKNRYGGRDRLALDTLTAQQNAKDSERDDSRELLKVLSDNYTAMLTSNHEIVVKNADLAATVRIQTAQIERLASDVSALQTENATLKARVERMTALDAEVATLKARIGDLMAQLRDKDTDMMRLTIELQQCRADAARITRPT